MTTSKFLFFSLLTLAALIATTVRATGNPRLPAANCGELGDACCEPGCDVCYSSIEKVTETRSCWTVECEKICVPRVVSPWAEGGSGLTLFNCFKKKPCDGCDAECDACRPQPRCGCVLPVLVLGSKDYEVTKHRCNWEIRRLPPCGDGCDCGEVTP